MSASENNRRSPDCCMIRISADGKSIFQESKNMIQFTKQELEWIIFTSQLMLEGCYSLIELYKNPDNKKLIESIKAKIEAINAD